MLKDFYRLAYMPAEFTDRWCVQVLSDRMRRYLDNAADRYGVRVAEKVGATTLLEPEAALGLPATARSHLERWLPDLQPVQARCVAAHPAGAGLTLTIHRVTPVEPTTSEEHDL